MNDVLSNQWVVIGVVVLLISLSYNVYAFIQLSPGQQKEKVQEWLLWAVFQAEAELGGGTGQLKLRKVYEMFISTFPRLVQLISFKEFSDMVDIALDKMRAMLDNNAKVQNLVDDGQVNKLSALIDSIKALAKINGEEGN